MKRLSKQKISKISLIILADLIFFSLTNPNNSKAIYLVIGFALTIVSGYLLITGLVGLLSWYGIHLHNKRRLINLLSGLLAVLLGLESLGELNLKEVLIIMPFFLLLYIYLSFDRQTLR